MSTQKEVTVIKNLRKTYSDDRLSMKLDDLYVKYLGKKGEIKKLIDSKDKIADPEIRKVFLKQVNILKSEIKEDTEKLRDGDASSENNIKLDLSIPVANAKTGNLHPTTITAHNLIDFFKYYGFSHAESSHIETDYYNFEMLGVGKDHPARELQDTIYINEPDLLLRTQTSSTEARYLEKFEPPIRCVSYGPVFRNETNSKTNGAFFHQFQGFYVDYNVNLGHLKWIFDKAIKHILGDDTVIRFRSKYYPEVMPCLSPDVQCKFCGGDGCEVCKYRGWIEIAGGGMIHPETLQKAGIDNKIFSGFAFGMGLDRIVMNKFKIDDLRTLYNSSIVYKN